MQIFITFEDKGARTVIMTTEMSLTDSDQEQGQPTPAAILVMAVNTLFQNGQLASVGQMALKAISLGINPEEYVKQHFKEEILNDAVT